MWRAKYYPRYRSFYSNHLRILLGLTEMGQEIAFEPEMFLVMIIGPLLFREGERADVPEILKTARSCCFWLLAAF